MRLKRKQLPFLWVCLFLMSFYLLFEALPSCTVHSKLCQTNLLHTRENSMLNSLRLCKHISHKGSVGRVRFNSTSVSPKAVLLSDYKPHPFKVTDVNLTFKLHDTETQVKSELKVHRQASGRQVFWFLTLRQFPSGIAWQRHCIEVC